MHKMKVVRESQQSVEGYQQAGAPEADGFTDEARELALPEQQSANMVMCEENVSQLESGAQIAEAGEEDGKKRFSNEIEREVPCLHFEEDQSRAGASMDPIAAIASAHTPSTVLSSEARDYQQTP